MRYNYVNLVYNSMDNIYSRGISGRVVRKEGGLKQMSINLYPEMNDKIADPCWEWRGPQAEEGETE